MRIYLSTDMLDRTSERGCYDILAVGNGESVVLLPVMADPPLALNFPCYADIKVKVFSVNVSVIGGRNGNGQCEGGG